ncbi:MAG: pyridoxal-phosphate dependent enzyme [Polyangiaceae bacterium]
MKPLPTPVSLGDFPTPVFRARELERGTTELWVKHDGVSAEPYGGNKVRKLEWILGAARARHPRRLLTTGAGGSHHVLATAVYAARVGIPVAAVLCPQPHTAHAEATLRASLGLGVEPYRVGSMASVPFGVARAFRRGDLFVPAGGSSALGSYGYARAVGELSAQIRAGELPEPDVIVVPLGSGGTAAGILVGVLRERLGCRVIGVSVAVGARVGRAVVLALARAVARLEADAPTTLQLARALEVDARHLGAGYGHATDAGARATARARSVGLELDPTYTAKTFARALEEAHADGPDTASGRARVVLYWHTLSSRSLAPLLEAAPKELPEPLAPLLPRR